MPRQTTPVSFQKSNNENIYSKQSNQNSRIYARNNVVNTSNRFKQIGSQNDHSRESSAAEISGDYLSPAGLSLLEIEKRNSSPFYTEPDKKKSFKINNQISSFKV